MNKITVQNSCKRPLHMAFRLGGQVDKNAVNRGEATLPALFRMTFPPLQSVHFLTDEQLQAFEAAKKKGPPLTWFGKDGVLAVEGEDAVESVPEDGQRPANVGGDGTDESASGAKGGDAKAGGKSAKRGL